MRGATVEDALQRMSENSLTAIPVVDRETHAFVGTITSQEILEMITTEVRGEVQESGLPTELDA